MNNLKNASFDNRCYKSTHTKQRRAEKLLLVLKFPHVPLHNNPAELGARVAVRKRDVSLHPLVPPTHNEAIKIRPRFRLKIGMGDICRNFLSFIVMCYT